MASAHFYCTAHPTADGLGIFPDSVIFHGAVVDDRGEVALSVGALAHERVQVAYDVEFMTITIGSEIVGADDCAPLLTKYASGRNIVLEATTLGFAELFCLVRAFIALGVKALDIIYAEPVQYTKPPGAGDTYALSELITGYAPIPNAIVDLSSDEVEAGVFFLGYEQERLSRALEEYQMIANKSVKVVFGVPAFQAGWELNAIVPHLPTLVEQQNFDVAYCSASDPSSAFECLETTRQSLSHGGRMFIAPIGTKPCGVATAVFASIFSDQAGILFDHPRKKSKRSSGVHLWHKYRVRVI